jgi:hypothetical protein
LLLILGSGNFDSRDFDSFRSRWCMLGEVVLLACGELTDDDKHSCMDLVFKVICLEILIKAGLVLANENVEEFSLLRLKD